MGRWVLPLRAQILRKVFSGENRSSGLIESPGDTKEAHTDDVFVYRFAARCESALVSKAYKEFSTCCWSPQKFLSVVRAITVKHEKDSRQ